MFQRKNELKVFKRALIDILSSAKRLPNRTQLFPIQHSLNKNFIEKYYFLSENLYFSS